jgi:myo-inositol-1(or 4)-monophosphatase
MNLENICNQAIELIKHVGIFILEQNKVITAEKVEVKGLHNYVTYVDKTAEEKLISGLSKILPGSGFIVEEQTVDFNNEEFVWIIDPLDGTTNYIHGLAPYAISVALMQKDETLIGIVYEMNLNECFYTWKGQPSLLNGQPIHVSVAKNVKDSLIATGFPYYDYDRMAKFMNSLEFFMRNSHGMRRLGSAAADLAYVAAGRFEAFYEYSLSPWDVAAGAFLVQQAGGKVSDFKGGTNYIFGKEIIATNHHIYNEFLQVVKEHLE